MLTFWLLGLVIFDYHQETCKILIYESFFFSLTSISIMVVLVQETSNKAIVPSLCLEYNPVHLWLQWYSRHNKNDLFCRAASCSKVFPVVILDVTIGLWLESIC